MSAADWLSEFLRQIKRICGYLLSWVLPEADLKTKIHICIAGLRDKSKEIVRLEREISHHKKQVSPTDTQSPVLLGTPG